jgi:hypothetical protein
MQDANHVSGFGYDRTGYSGSSLQCEGYRNARRNTDQNRSNARGKLAKNYASAKRPGKIIGEFIRVNVRPTFAAPYTLIDVLLQCGMRLTIGTMESGFSRLHRVSRLGEGVTCHRKTSHPIFNRRCGGNC